MVKPKINDLPHITPLGPYMIGCNAYDLSSFSSLDGVELFQSCRFYGLHNITSLNKVRLVKNCRLFNLRNITSLDDVKFADGCALCGLTKKIMPWYWGNNMNQDILNVFGY